MAPRGLHHSGKLTLVIECSPRTLCYQQHPSTDLSVRFHTVNGRETVWEDLLPDMFAFKRACNTDIVAEDRLTMPCMQV